MKRLKTGLTSAALALGLAASAQAATVTGTGTDVQTVTFAWTSTPFSEEATVTATKAFTLSLDSYTGTGSQQTGYYLDFDGTRLTTDTSACSSAAWANPGRCDLITGSTQDGTVLFSQLAAGTYAFGVYDSATPVSGTLAFTLAAVPVPAGGLMLLGALGGFAALRRRKKAA